MSRLSVPCLESATDVAAEFYAQIRKQLFMLGAIAPLAALCTMAFVESTTAASAGQYCWNDASSQAVSCTFDSLEQCQATSSGRGGGDCFRDPFLPVADKLAYAPNALRVRGQNASREGTSRPEIARRHWGFHS